MKTPGQMEGQTERKNGQGLFYTTLLATAQGPPRV